MTPTTQMLDRAKAVMTPTYAPLSFIAERGDGSYLFDAEGNRYLDFSGGIGVNALGHAHPDVVRAISAQAAKLLHTSNMFFHRGYIEVCEALCARSFGARVFLTNSGTEANEAAVKLARRYFFTRGENRSGIVAAHGSFHGRTLGALALTGQPNYHEGFGPMLPHVSHVPYGDAEAMRTAVDAGSAAVILEPILGNSGVRPAPAGYLEAVRKICDDAGALLIFDEVQTGIGRTGKWFAHQHSGATPDIMTVAKALGGGLPLGAAVCTAEVGDALTLGTHGTTFGGNPVACAAALATIEVIERDNLLARANELGDYFMGALRELASSRDTISEIRGLGMMIGVVVKDAKAARAACLAQGLLTTLAGSDVLRLMPPLTATREEIDAAVAMMAAAL